MTRYPARAALLLMVSLIGVATSGCTRLRGHQGYVIDTDLVNSVQPGVDTRESVAKVLGKPSFAGQFEANDWYYVSRETRSYAYNTPRAKDQTVLHVRFDDKGTVVAVDRSGIDKVAAINPYNKTTPTLGRSRSFFEDLFGNIGAVGAGPGAAGGGGQGGGGNGP